MEKRWKAVTSSLRKVAIRKQKREYWHEEKQSNTCQKQEQRWNACVKQDLTLSKTAFVTSFLKQIIETTVWKVEDDSPNIINAENV